MLFVFASPPPPSYFSTWSPNLCVYCVICCFKNFPFIIPFLFLSAPGAATARSRKKLLQDQGAASYHVLQKIDVEDLLVMCNNLFFLLSALTFQSIAVTFTAGFLFKNWVFFPQTVFLNRNNSFAFLMKKQLFYLWIEFLNTLQDIWIQSFKIPPSQESNMQKLSVCK